jgi:hypothetical protein
MTVEVPQSFFPDAQTRQIESMMRATHHVLLMAEQPTVPTERLPGEWLPSTPDSVMIDGAMAAFVDKAMELVDELWGGRILINEEHELIQRALTYLASNPERKREHTQLKKLYDQAKYEAEQRRTRSESEVQPAIGYSLAELLDSVYEADEAAVREAYEYMDSLTTTRMTIVNEELTLNRLKKCLDQLALYPKVGEILRGFLSQFPPGSYGDEGNFPVMMTR